jgi:hypothetical protein
MKNNHLRGTLLCVLLVIAVTALPLQLSRTCGASSGINVAIRHVILIVLDDVRPDVLLEANTPCIDAMITEGSYTWNAWTVEPSVTLAAVPSIFTGATPAIHQVNSWQGEIHAETMVEVFEEAGLQCAIIGYDPVVGGYQATYCTGYADYPDPDEYFMSVAIDMFVEHRPYFMAIDDPLPDMQAHAHGHESSEYREAIERADYNIGRLIDKLKELDVYNRTLIVITTDHGVTGTTHGYGYETDMRIFSIWRGPGVRRGYEMKSCLYIPSGTTHGEVKVAHRIIDIAPTIMEIVGLRPPNNCEGSVIHQLFMSTELLQEYDVLMNSFVSLQHANQQLVSELERLRSEIARTQSALLVTGGVIFILLVVIVASSGYEKHRHSTPEKREGE